MYYFYIYIIILLLILFFYIINYFNTIEEFSNIYVEEDVTIGTTVKYGITCSRCRDGAEPDNLKTGCQQCYRDAAGTGGSCTPCGDGTEANSDKTECVDCPSTHIKNDKTYEICVPCGRGQEPNSNSSECVDCGVGTAGTGGSCTPCGDGKRPNTNYPVLTTCVPCGSGTAGVEGICAPCGDGQAPNSGKTECVDCGVGTAGTGGSCTPCDNGTQPNSGKTACNDCLSTQAGSGETCAPCLDGQEPNSNSSECVDCGVGTAGTGGSCTPCGDGTQPNSGKTACDDCLSTQAGSGGTCAECLDGQFPNSDSTECVDCGLGRFRSDGSCNDCTEDYYCDGINENECQSCRVEDQYMYSICTSTSDTVCLDYSDWETLGGRAVHSRTFYVWPDDGPTETYNIWKSAADTWAVCTSASGQTYSLILWGSHLICATTQTSGTIVHESLYDNGVFEFTQGESYDSSHNEAYTQASGNNAILTIYIDVPWGRQHPSFANIMNLQAPNSVWNDAEYYHLRYRFASFT